MQLRVARLCLDCEELHEQYRCPVCASDHFSYVSRWVPAPERRRHPRAEVPPPESLDVYRQVVNPSPRRGRFISRALVGLGAAGVIGLFLGGQKAGARDRDPGPSDQ